MSPGSCLSPLGTFDRLPNLKHVFELFQSLAVGGHSDLYYLHLKWGIITAPD